MRLSEMVSGNLPAGRYTVTITDVDMAVSKQNKPKVQFKAVTTDGKSQVWSRSLQDTAIFSLSRDLLSLGVADIELSDDPEERRTQLVELAQSLLNETVEIEVSPQKDNSQYVDVVIVGNAAGSNAGDVLDRL